MYCLGLLWMVPMRFEIVGTTAHRWGFKVLTPRLVKAFHDRGVSPRKAKTARLLHLRIYAGSFELIRESVSNRFSKLLDRNKICVLRRLGGM